MNGGRRAVTRPDRRHTPRLERLHPGIRPPRRHRTHEPDGRGRCPIRWPITCYSGCGNGRWNEAIEVSQPEDLLPAWERALSADRPVLLDVRCAPEVPPIPPYATWEQMKSTAEAVLRGDPDAWHLVVQGAKTKAQEFVPSRDH